jgi:hypothetical protein
MGSGLVNSANQNGRNPMNNFVDEHNQYLKIEDKRFRCMLDLMLKYREWEEERVKLQLMQGSNNTNGSPFLDESNLNNQ